MDVLSTRQNNGSFQFTGLKNNWENCTKPFLFSVKYYQGGFFKRIGFLFLHQDASFELSTDLFQWSKLLPFFPFSSPFKTQSIKSNQSWECVILFLLLHFLSLVGKQCKNCQFTPLYSVYVSTLKSTKQKVKLSPTLLFSVQ